VVDDTLYSHHQLVHLFGTGLLLGDLDGLSGFGGMFHRSNQSSLYSRHNFDPTLKMIERNETESKSNWQKRFLK
jgi:hypothetical protein